MTVSRARKPSSGCSVSGDRFFHSAFRSPSHAAVKPTSSILTPRRTVDRNNDDTEILTKGRHDPCVGIRAVPVGEAMMACVLADHFLRHRGQVGK